MADKELSDLTAASALDGTEVMLITQAGNSRKLDIDTFATYVVPFIDPGTVEVYKTSSDTETLGTGSKTLTFDVTAVNIGWDVGIRLRCFHDDTHYMEGEMTAVTDTDVTILIDYVVGSGSYSGWNILITGSPGATGPAGADGAPGSWGSLTGYAGRRLQVKSDESDVEWVTNPYDVGLFIGGKPSNAELVFKFTAVRAFTLPSSLTGSYAKAVTAATGSTTFTFKKNGTSFATCVFSASGTTGAFTAASSTSFAAGDILTIEAPATADATLADISFNLKGSY